MPVAVQQAYAETAATLAAQTGMPVTIATVPVDRLDALRDAARPRRRGAPPRVRARRRVRIPRRRMSSALFLWQEDGRPDWGSMWTTFCDLALYGARRSAEPTAHCGPHTAPRRARTARCWRRCGAASGRRRGLYAESGEPGWLAITCESPTMAAWMCAAIILENVDARVDEDRLMLPAGPDYELKDQVKSIITVVAKTHHYWQAHIAGAERG